MKSLGSVVALYTTTPHKETLEHQEISLDLKGIIGDKHYGKDTSRSILISATKSYEMTKVSLGVTMPQGYLGENLLFDFDPYDLPVGTQLHIGSAVLEITQNCTLCNHLSELDKRIPKLLRHDRGIFAKVTRPGTIQKTDPIYLG